MDRYEWTLEGSKAYALALGGGMDYQSNVPAGYIVRELLRLAEENAELRSTLADQGRVLFLHGPEIDQEQAERAMRAHGQREARLTALEAENRELLTDNHGKAVELAEKAHEIRELKEERDTQPNCPTSQENAPKPRAAFVAVYGGGEHCPDGELHVVGIERESGTTFCRRCDARLRLTGQTGAPGKSEEIRKDVSPE